MIQDLHDVQACAGATFIDNIATSFGNDAAAIKATHAGVAVVDRTHWGRIQVSDDDRIRFLHNQSTNNFEALKPGQGCDTVFVTSTARTIDLATAYVTDEAVILLVSPNSRKRLIEWLDRYIFFADKVKLTDLTEQTAAFSAIGPQSDTLLEKLGCEQIIGQAHGTHQVFQVSLNSSTTAEVRVAVGSSLTTPGYTLMVSAEVAAPLWKKLVDIGAVPLGENAWEQLRIQQGRPMPERELTEDYNPLEAGLWHTISFEKGCYIGQETIARLNTYKGVKQQLWGVRLQAPASPGTVVQVGEEKVGLLTSYIETESGKLGLAYIRTKAGGEGLKVKVGDTEGEVIDLPFLSRTPE